MNIIQSPSHHQFCAIPKMMYHENHTSQQMRKGSPLQTVCQKSSGASGNKKGLYKYSYLFDIFAKGNSGRTLSRRDNQGNVAWVRSPEPQKQKQKREKKRKISRDRQTDTDRQTNVLTINPCND